MKRMIYILLLSALVLTDCGLKLRAKPVVRNKPSTFVTNSFVYRSQTTRDKTPQLQWTFDTMTNIVAFYSPATRKPKITYLIDPSVRLPMANYDQSTIVDPWDCCSSHEMIHTVVLVSNLVFNEGFAQCFQMEGNRTYEEQNVNLAASAFSTAASFSFESILAAPQDYPFYQLAGSFIYYNTQVHSDTQNFTRFLKSLRFEDTVATVSAKFETATGVTLAAREAEWQAWLRTVDASSDITIDWPEWKGKNR